MNRGRRFDAALTIFFARHLFAKFFCPCAQEDLLSCLSANGQGAWRTSAHPRQTELAEGNIKIGCSTIL